MRRLAHYLQKIKAGKTINFKQFIGLLPANIRLDHEHVFKATLVAPKQYAVEVLDPVIFDKLLADCLGSSDNRVAAALAGDSHQVVSSFGFILVFHQGLTTTRPDVVVVNGEGFEQGFVSKSTLLVIENQENFFRYQQMLPLLTEFYAQPLDLTTCDIAFGVGQQINKALNLSFLEQYDNLLCAFDYDLGALRMVDGLKQRLNMPVQLLQPQDFTPWLEYFRRVPDSDNQLHEAIVLADKLAYTNLSGVLHQSKRFLEQEVFLTV